MKIITFASWKGGTGKTTLSASVAKTLSKQGKKILIIDLDSNLSMTRIFGLVGKSHTSIDLLNGDNLDNLTYSPYGENNSIHIIPSDLRISRMSNLSDRVLKVNLKKIKNISEYDYIFIDPPGTMNALTRNAICVADKIIIPAMPSEIDFQATELVIEEMEMMGIDSDVQIVLNGNNPEKNLKDIYFKFSNDYEDWFYSEPISLMKSLRNLTANISKYKLRGIAKKIIDDFTKVVIK